MSPIAKIVHFVNYGIGGTPTCKAAMVTEVLGLDVAHLVVFGTNALFFKMSVPYSAGREPGTFHHLEEAHGTAEDPPSSGGYSIPLG